MNKLIIDTDILIDYGRGDEKALNFLNDTRLLYDHQISVMSWLELIIGARNKKELKIIGKFIGQFGVIHFQEDISLQAVQLLSQYRLSHGLMIGDALIAASALFLDCPVASKNRKDYLFIENLQLLDY
jgi:predicted nucleic acid-binding protein